MKFKICGPFRLPTNRKGTRVVNDKNAVNKFWDSVDTKVPGLSEARGCYIFAIRAGRGSKPWYVGKAVKQSFRRESLHEHKIVHYNDAYDHYDKGTQIVFFVAQLTKGGKFRKPGISGLAEMGQLENMLIGMGVSRNARLRNIKGTKLMREMVIPGILNSSKGKLEKGASSLKKLLGGK